MNKKEVIKKTIKKAKDSGWEDKNNFDEDFTVVKQNLVYGWDKQKHLNELLFNHDFAKSLFGDTPYCTACEQKAINAFLCRQFNNGITEAPAWQYHLQQLAVTEDRIEYLKDYLSNQ